MTSHRPVVLITGATSGVGAKLVQLMHPTHHVIALGRNPTKLRTLVSRHPAVDAIECDLADAASVVRTARRIQETHPRIDVLVCNAALQHEPMLTDPDCSPEEIEREITVNFTFVALLIHGILPTLVDGERPATIALVNSALALAPKRGSATYCASKAALRSLGWSLQGQLAERQVRVVNAYLPLVDTPMTAGRGSGKISADEAARGILAGIACGKPEHFIGKARHLNRLHRLSPALARRIMQKA